MSEKDENLAAQVQRETDEMGELVWRNVMAETVLELLERENSVTKDSLRKAFESRIVDDNLTRIQRATYQGALKALDGNPPS